MSTDFNEIFKWSEDYPKISGEILPYGTLYEYISSTFLNGFINYVDIRYAVASNRYWDDEDVRNFGDWEEFISNMSKRTEPHTNLDTYRSDICCYGLDNHKDFIFFYFDRDVSDCCIGRLEKESTTEELLKQYVINTSLNKAEGYQETPKILQIKKPKGWVSF